MGEEAAARACARRALESYPFCPKPRLALGSMLVSAGRMRAALRHFEIALDLALEDDENDAWEASLVLPLLSLPQTLTFRHPYRSPAPFLVTPFLVTPFLVTPFLVQARSNAALAVVRLTQRFGKSPVKLPVAIAWLLRSLNAAPDDERLLTLLKEATELTEASIPRPPKLRIVDGTTGRSKEYSSS